MESFYMMRSVVGIVFFIVCSAIYAEKGIINILKTALKHYNVNADNK